VEINIDSSNGQNDLEPKIVGLGLAIRVSMFAKIRYKDIFVIEICLFVM